MDTLLIYIILSKLEQVYLKRSFCLTLVEWISSFLFMRIMYWKISSNYLLIDQVLFIFRLPHFVDVELFEVLSTTSHVSRWLKPSYRDWLTFPNLQLYLMVYTYLTVQQILWGKITGSHYSLVTKEAPVRVQGVRQFLKIKSASATGVLI